MTLAQKDKKAADGQGNPQKCIEANKTSGCGRFFQEEKEKKEKEERTRKQGGEHG